MLNSPLSRAIHSFLTDEKNYISPETIKTAYLTLQKKYTDLKQTDITTLKTTSPLINSEAMRIAYLLSRMPATSSVVNAILETGLKNQNLNDIHSLLDIGTGTGAVLWAAMNSPLQLSHITALDYDPHILTLAKKLTQYEQEPFWDNVTWLQQDLNHTINVAPHDVVTLSYALIEQPDIIPILDSIWPLFNKILILIEPGTTKGFSNILKARDYYINKGAFIIAPCSHMEKCPIKAGNWCHFNERIERSKWQQTLKNASLGYEDEAYSYLIVAKSPSSISGLRIISSPTKKSGHIILDLCAPHNIKSEIVTRSQKNKYKLAKKKKWGDSWED